MTVIVWAVLRYTRWGFQVAVVGGNAEAARRSGLNVGRLILSALHDRRRPGRSRRDDPASPASSTSCDPASATSSATSSFLACWLARHQPLPDPRRCVRVRLALGRAATASSSTPSSRQRRQRPHGTHPDGRPRLDDEEKGLRMSERQRVNRGHLMPASSISSRGRRYEPHRGRAQRRSPRWHLDHVRRSGRDRLRACRRHQPRHRGVDADAGRWPATPCASRPEPVGRVRSPAPCGGAVLSLLHAYFVVWRHANQFATGLTCAVPRPRPDVAVRRQLRQASRSTAFDQWDVPLLSRHPVRRRDRSSSRTPWSTCRFFARAARWWFICSQPLGLLVRDRG